MRKTAKKVKSVPLYKVQRAKYVQRQESPALVLRCKSGAKARSATLDDPGILTDIGVDKQLRSAKTTYQGMIWILLAKQGKFRVVSSPGPVAEGLNLPEDIKSAVGEEMLSVRMDARGSDEVLSRL